MVAAEPSRAWAAIEMGYVWHVCRADGMPAAVSSFYFGARGPLDLQGADAKSLATTLNGVRLGADKATR